MIDYKEIEDVIQSQENLAYKIGIPSNEFLDALEMLEEGIDMSYNYDEWISLLREIRNNQFGRARGENKSILDNLLNEVLDIASYS